jgi:hypothetical protein
LGGGPRPAASGWDSHKYLRNATFIDHGVTGLRTEGDDLSGRRRKLAHWKSAGAVLILLALAFCTQASDAAAQSPEAGHQPYEWPYRLPIWGERMAKRGIGFPLPWGVGLNYAFVDQPITIDSVEIAVNDSAFVNLDNIVKFRSVNSRVHAVNARMDVWLFPFLNLYGLVNYAAQAKTAVQLSEPFEFTAGATQPGGGGGLGTTLAMGFWGFFGTIDFNWTRNKMQKLDAPVNTFLLTPRFGRKLFRVGTFELTAWAGAMFQHIGVDTSGKIKLSDAIGEPSDAFRDKVQNWYDNLSPPRQAVVRSLVDEIQGGGDATIRYRLDKRVANPWNMVVGTQLEFTPNWQMRVEVGFIHRTQVIVGFNYRFGVGKPGRVKSAVPH